MWTTLGTLIDDFSFSGEQPFTWSPKVSPKWISRSRNTLPRWAKDHIEAHNMYVHLSYLGNLLLKFLAFSENYALTYVPNLTEMDNSVEEHAKEIS